MNVKIKLVDPTLPVPEYKSAGAVAFDIYSRLDMTLKPFEPTIVPSNLIVKIPNGYMLSIAARSSLPKYGLMVANGVGTIDGDFCGETDEIGMFLVNITKKPVHVERGQRLCQGIFHKVGTVKKFTVVKKMGKKSRGGFGTTGKK
ncbi:MAG: dUTP diphosphatase [Patescibacteria group bacterium]